MTPNAPKPAARGGLFIAFPLLMAAGLGLWVFTELAGRGVWVFALAQAVMEFATMGLVLIAAGGWGYLLIGPLAPKDAGDLFRAVSAVGVGLWMLSTAMLIIGAFVPGGFSPWVWYSVIGLGVLLAGKDSRKQFQAAEIPKFVGHDSLMWILLGICIAVWWAGAARPSGFIAQPDAYDVLEYHLQVPREFFNAGHIGELQHNAYSYYPLGVEMLFLVGFALRSSAYEGMYLAKMLHGMFGLLAVAAVVTGLREDHPRRGKYAGLLLAATPGLLYLSWLAFVELAVVAYLALAVMWLRRWMKTYDLRSAVCVGLMLGAACAMKYLAVGFVLLPVGLVMLVASLLRDRKARLKQVLLACGVALVLMSPWLIRNAIHTGNPVFPLATDLFGRGQWTGEEARRWQAGHAATPHPPVPEPPHWQPPPHPSRLDMLWMNFLTSPFFGWGMLAAGVLSVCALLATRGFLRRRPWETALLGILLAQVAIWVAVARNMPWRFLIPAAVPLALLAAGGLDRLADREFLLPQRDKRDLRRRNIAPWLAVGSLLLVVLIDLLAAALVYRESSQWSQLPPWKAGEVAEWAKPYNVANALMKADRKNRIMLVGDAQGWYYPQGTIYATTFDRHPLAELAAEPITDRQRLEALRKMGVTHIMINWPEVWRLAGTYGYPPELTEGLYELWQAGRQPDLPVLRSLRRAGAKVQYVPGDTLPTPVVTGKTWQPFRRPIFWPRVQLYALPPEGAPDDWQPPEIKLPAYGGE